MPINSLDTAWLVGVPLGAGTLPTFGLPPCMLNLTLDILKLFPGDGLGALTAGINKGITRAQTVIFNSKNWIFDLIGAEDLDGDGIYDWSLDSGLGGLGDFMDSGLGVIGDVIGSVTASVDFVNHTVDELNHIRDCIMSFHDSLKKSVTVDPISNQQTEALLFEQEVIIAQATDFIVKAVDLLEMIGSVVIARKNGDIFDPDIDEEEE